MRHVVIFGAPGSGKGTQSAKIVEQLGFLAMSTGDLLRAGIASGSEIGRACEAVMAQGKFPDSSMIYQVVENFLLQTSDAKGVLYDGFPRTVDQAKFLIEFLEKQDAQIECVLNVQVDHDALVKRITGRFTCVKCGEIYNRYYKPCKSDGVCDICQSEEFKVRSDDTEETIKTRLQMYQNETAPVLDFLRDRNVKVVSIDGMQQMDVVFDQIENALSNE